METKPYTPFDHLLNSDDINEYLTSAIEDDDPAVFITALGHDIRHKGAAATAKVIVKAWLYFFWHKPIQSYLHPSL